MANENANKSIIGRKDLVYWMIILVIALIAILSFRLADDITVINYFGFAGTLISIILAIIAIIYSFFQNFAFSGLNSQLIETSNLLKLASEKIDESSTTYSENGNNLLQSISKLTISMKESIEEELNKTSSHISILENKISELTELASTTQEESTRVAFNYTEEEIDSFIKTSSVIGSYVLYSLVVAYKNQLEFEIRDLCIKVFSDVSSDYAFGYYIAIKNLGIITAEKIDNKLKVLSVNSFVISKIYTKIEKKEIEGSAEYRSNIMAYFKSIASDVSE